MENPAEHRITTRRSFLTTLAASVGALATAGLDAQSAQPAAAIREMVVYKDANCGCCKEWIKHVRAAGFTVKVNDLTEMAMVKRSFGVPPSLESCHTARIGRYTIEGHVPADLILRLLKEQPATARGLSVPGMPVGAPGMEQGNQKDKYNVILFDSAGKTRVYASR
jgi:hypothetical protein